MSNVSRRFLKTQTQFRPSNVSMNSSQFDSSIQSRNMDTKRSYNMKTPNKKWRKILYTTKSQSFCMYYTASTHEAYFYSQITQTYKIHILPFIAPICMYILLYLPKSKFNPRSFVFSNFSYCI